VQESGTEQIRPTHVPLGRRAAKNRRPPARFRPWPGSAHPHPKPRALSREFNGPCKSPCRPRCRPIPIRTVPLNGSHHRWSAHAIAARATLEEGPTALRLAGTKHDRDFPKTTQSPGRRRRMQHSFVAHRVSLSGRIHLQRGGRRSQSAPRDQAGSL
jgi:hypothetical protein